MEFTIWLRKDYVRAGLGDHLHGLWLRKDYVRAGNPFMYIIRADGNGALNRRFQGIVRIAQIF